MENLIASFPILKEQTYLDTPAVGLFPKVVLDFKAQQNNILWNEGSRYWATTANMAAEVREKIAEVFNAKPGYIALFPAFSYGMNAVLDSLPPEAKVLLLKDDYPSVTETVTARAFKVSYAAIKEDMENQIWEAFEKSQPDVFVLGIVQYITGIRIDFSFIKELKAKYPSTIIIGDGTQYLGTESFDFENSGFDAIGASAYKWIGAGFGNGFFMFKQEMENRLEPKNSGTSSNRGRYKEKGNTLIGKFEGNHLNMADIGAIKVGLEFHQKLGLQKIYTKIADLSLTTRTALTDMNLLEDRVVRRQQHSNIFNIKGDDALFKKLADENIICVQRGSGIRIGIHYYNTAADIERFLKVISS